MGIESCPAQSPGRHEAHQTGKTRIVDLTIPLVHGMDAFPGEPTAHFSRFSSTEDNTGVEMWNVSIFSQLGTHVDAPSHFITGAPGVEAMDLNSCIGPAAVVDLDGPAVTADALRPAEARIRAARRVIIRTGWSVHVGTPQYWQDFAEVEPAAAELLVSWGVRFVGLDTPTPSLTHLHDVHRTLLEAGIVIAECLANVDQLSADTYVICLPLPLVGLDGSPARIVAIENAQQEELS